ncbi:MAG: hypothetical protein ABGZ17_07755 [Planctomycetaceae bacterium]
MTIDPPPVTRLRQSGRRRPPLATLCLTLLALSGCDNWHVEQQADPAQVSEQSALQQANRKKIQTKLQFQTLSPKAGVVFTYQDGQQAGHVSILESLGGGLAVLDYDVDGHMDLFCPGGGHFGPGQAIAGNQPALFRNVGDWNFTTETGPAH